MRSFLLIAFLAACAVDLSADTMLYVAPAGNDANPGTEAKPFATLERARDEIRKLKSSGLPAGGVTVVLRQGVYERRQTFELTAADSGTATAPIEYRAAKGEEVRLVGGRVVTGFKPVTDQKVLSQWDAAARGKVLVADLRALGINEFPGIKRPGIWAQSEPGLELFFKDRPMRLARWPNDGFVKIPQVLGPTEMNVRGTKGTKEGIFAYEGDRPNRWQAEKEIWVHGYWFWDWADERQRVESIDREQHVIKLAGPSHTYGYRKGQWYYAENLLCELDQPGEWFLDREQGLLYFWPPAPLENNRAMVSLLPTLVTLSNVSHVTLRGVILEGCRSAALIASGGTKIKIAGCVVRNIGKHAISMSNVTDSGVVGCDVYFTGEGGISLTGGDRKTLTPANLYAENNHVHHYSRWNPVYKAGIRVEGVGNRIAHNLIDNAPHMAIGFGGNDHVIEFNEIHSVCFESNDAGAMYAGRNWSTRGTIVRHNYLHHLYGREARGCVGVYLDDQFSGTRIEGNLFYDVTRAAMIGGGRDCTVANNIFVDCTPAVHVDARGLGWAQGGFEGLKKGLASMPYQNSPWKEKYPQLLTLLDDEPMAPKGNVIERNICVGGRWDAFEGKAKPFIKFGENLLDQDPKFVAAEKQDFRLRDDSPAWKIGFQKILLEKIGVQKDADRATWPVTSTVRPKPEKPVAPKTEKPAAKTDKAKEKK